MNVPKLLIVDKTVFHALHGCDEKLFAFARNYNVVLPDALAVECLITGLLQFRPTLNAA